MEKYAHEVQVEAQEGEWQQKQAYLFHQEELQRYYHQLFLIHQFNQQRLAILGAEGGGSVQHKPSHFSFFSYDIHDKDAFRKSISRRPEEPNYCLRTTIRNGILAVLSSNRSARKSSID